jgi:hypothetical protein
MGDAVEIALVQVSGAGVVLGIGTVVVGSEGYRHSMLTSPHETYRLIGVFSNITSCCDDSVFLTVVLRRLGAKELLGHNMSSSSSFKLGYSIA